MVWTDNNGKLTWTTINWNDVLLKTGWVIMTGNLNLNLNRIVNLNLPINNNDCVNKLYVDNLLWELHYIDDIIFHNIISDNISTPPLINDTGDGYIVGIAPSGLWTGKQGYLVFYDGFNWIDILTWIASGMRFGVWYKWQFPSGSFTLLKNKIVTYNGTWYDVYEPKNNDIVIINNEQYEWGNKLIYNNDAWTTWEQYDNTIFNYENKKYGIKNNSINYNKLNLNNSITLNDIQNDVINKNKLFYYNNWGDVNSHNIAKIISYNNGE